MDPSPTVSPVQAALHDHESPADARLSSLPYIVDMMERQREQLDLTRGELAQLRSDLAPIFSLVHQLQQIPRVAKELRKQ